MIQRDIFLSLKSELDASGVTLIAVSKTQPPEAVLDLYRLGQRIFGENRVQELMEKRTALPSDIQWHLIGHLQTNKIRMVLPIVSMIASVDSIRLLKAIHKEAASIKHTIEILLQIKISVEATKYGFDPLTVVNDLSLAGITKMPYVQFRGVMGMASFVDDEAQIRHEFKQLKEVYDLLKQTVFNDHIRFDQISMGMSGDYRLAIEEGSTMVRIGSLIFGERAS
jgi:hypothetical protein